MRILILGGDGYLGWPTAMRFSDGGHEVHVVDNYLRRRAHEEVGTDTLVPILDTLPERAAAWKEISGKEIGVTEGDLVQWDLTADLFRTFQPEAIVHYGEMPSAPYSMGTMGEYGTPNIDIEEGYLEIEHNGRKETILFPKLPGSLYHLSKVHDSNNIHFACRMWGIRATDLNQGVVYGIETEQTKLDDRLATRFDYDDVFGTALNRFCVQAMIGHPLTVYGKGGQTRGYLNILDTLQCVELAVLHPADRGEFRVFNQFTEQFSVVELAELVRHAGSEIGLDVRIEHLDNPRVELEEHYYNAKHTKLVELGLQPHLLSETLIESMFDVIERYKDRVILDHILPATRWRGVRERSSG
jgi:UDP-sulfoquinovose synthase